MRAYKYNGKMITKPGVYLDVPNADYHGGLLCHGPSISSTGLRKVLTSPAHYYASAVVLNPDYKPEPFDSRALKFGRAAHCAALEPEKFAADFAVSSFENFKTKAAQEERDGFEDRGIICLSQSDAKDIERMAKALKADQQAVSLFRDGVAEVTFVCQDEVTGIWLLARPDFVPTNPARGLVDYKTAANAEPEAWSRHAYDLGYDIQAALALHVVNEATKAMGDNSPAREVMWHVVQEKSEPYAVQCARWTDYSLRRGRRQMRAGIDRLAHCLQTNEWPAYNGQPFDVITPNWIDRKEDLIEEGMAA